MSRITPAISSSPGEIEITGDGLIIRFPYDERILDAVRCIPVRKWDKRHKVWSCPISSTPEVIKFLAPLGFPIPPDLLSRREQILKERAAKAKRRQERDAVRQSAETALSESQAEIAFTPAGDALLTRRIKTAGVFREVTELTDFGEAVIGYEVPDPVLVKLFDALGRPSDPCSRLLSILKYLFRINIEAKRNRSYYTTAITRYGKKEHLLREACRLAAKQERFAWGWKMDPTPPPNGAAWVVYFATEGRQVSFHTFQRGDGPDFAGDWDGVVNASFPW